MATSEEILGAGNYLRLVRRGRYEHVSRVKSTGVVAIVAITQSGEIILVEEPRPAVGSQVISVPAGLVGDDPGAQDEPLESAARRELEEETGFSAACWELLTTTPTSPGLTDESITFFLATDLTQVGAGGGVDDEAITVHRIPLATIDAWLKARLDQGVEADMKLYAGLHFAHEAQAS